MKKINPFAAGMITCIISCTFAAAQTTTDKLSQAMASVSVYKTVAAPESNTGVLRNTNIKAVSYFIKTYPSVSNETWERCKDGFVAKFFANGVEVKNFFDKKGNWLHSIQRYDESKLPKGVRAAVKSNYYDFSITQVQEINNQKSYAEPVYLVHIQSGVTFKLIKLCNEEMEEIQF